MKTFQLATLAGILISVFLSSCSKFQYATILSSQPTKSSGIEVENDTVKITYYFRGQNCPVLIEVYNKLNQPIFVDWAKSALIINEQRFSYWEDKTIVRTTTSATEINWTKSVSSSTGITSGTLSREEQVSFIPPKSFVKYNPLTVKSSFFELPPPVKQQEVHISNLNTSATAKKYTFSESNSPLTFRSYLTLSTSDSFSSSFHLDNDFWVSEILTTYAQPSVMNPASTQFTLSTSTGFTEAMVVLVGVPLIIAAAASHNKSK